MATTTINPTIDKQAAIQSIRVLMHQAGLSWTEVQGLNDTPSRNTEETYLSPEWEAMLQEARDEVARGDVLGPFTSVEEAMQALHQGNQ